MGYSYPFFQRVTAMIELTADQRRFLRAQAHHLNPTVMIGNQGLTGAVIREIARSLDAHELVKIRVLGDSREVRASLFDDICNQLDCAAVQMIGKLLIVYRPGAEPKIELPSGKFKPANLKTEPKPTAGPATPVRIDMGRPGGNRRRRMARRRS